MTKTEIFEEVVDIMKHDSASCKDEPGGDADAYHARIRDGMDEEGFLYVM